LCGWGDFSFVPQRDRGSVLICLDRGKSLCLDNYRSELSASVGDSLLFLENVFKKTDVEACFESLNYQSPAVDLRGEKVEVEGFLHIGLVIVGWCVCCGF
jgi:hypothetical protein